MLVVDDGSPDGARAVLTAARHVRNSARWTVALALGLRQSEALVLHWKDVDLATGTLTVRRSIHRVQGGLVHEEPKARRSQRTLVLPLPLVADLGMHNDWIRLLQSADVRHVRLHDGRHTAATLLSENVHPRVVVVLLGHSQMRTTMDIYSHVMPALAREAAHRMSGLLMPGRVGTTATRRLRPSSGWRTAWSFGWS